MSATTTPRLTAAWTTGLDGMAGIPSLLSDVDDMSRSALSSPSSAFWLPGDIPHMSGPRSLGRGMERSPDLVTIDGVGIFR
jgi:hypothetical protein